MTPLLLLILLAHIALASRCIAGTRPALSVNFDKWHIGSAYSLSHLKSDFKTLKTNRRFSGATIAAGISGGGLRITYPSGCVGSKCTLWLQAPLPQTTEVYVSYNVMFSNGFTFVKGGKLPGVCGGTCTSGARVSTGYNGFNTRIMWRNGGRLSSYVYHPDQRMSYGDDFNWNVDVKAGVWVLLEQRIVMNDIGTRNGFIETFYNGRKLFRHNNFEWRKRSGLMIDAFQFVTFFGGSGKSWAPKQRMQATFDNIEVCVR